MSRRSPKSFEFIVASAYIELTESIEVQKIMTVLRPHKRLDKQQILDRLPDVDPTKIKSCLQALLTEMILTTIDGNSEHSSYEINHTKLLPLVVDRLSSLAKKASESTASVMSIDAIFKYRCKNATKCGARFLAVEVDRMFYEDSTGKFSCPRCHHEVGEAHSRVEPQMTERLNYYHRKLLAVGNHGMSKTFPPLFGPDHVEVNMVTFQVSPDPGFSSPVISASSTPLHVPDVLSLPYECEYDVLGIDEPEPEIAKIVASSKRSSKFRESESGNGTFVGAQQVKKPASDANCFKKSKKEDCRLS